MQRILLVGACGPKKTASNGPGDIVPRQFNLPPPIQVRVLFGALRKEGYGEWDEFGNTFPVFLMLVQFLFEFAFRLLGQEELCIVIKVPLLTHQHKLAGSLCQLSYLMSPVL